MKDSRHTHNHDPVELSRKSDRSLMWKILLAIIFFIFSSAIAFAGVLPVGQHEYEFLYDRFEHIDASQVSTYDYQLGPYLFDNQDFILGPFEPYRAIEPNSLMLFSFLTEDFRSIKRAPSVGYESFRGGALGRPLKNVFVYGKFVLDEQRAEDPDYTGKKWRGLAGDVEEAFVNYSSDKFSLTVGRFGSFWGPRNSLVLSYSEPLDGFGYSFRWGKLVISYRLARLDGLNPDRDSVEQFENRYFAGHRFDFHFSPRIRVGLFEAVVYGGPGRQIELAYLNPLIFFHGSQLNDGADDNTMVGFDFSLKPISGVKLYGQLLIDDYQVDNESASDNEPAELGYIFGGYFAHVVSSLDIKTEYTRVNNWTFNQVLERNRYLIHDKPIGGALGNDYDLATLSLFRWLSETAALTAGVGYLRQGEGSVTADWTEPWLAASEDYSEKFPTGIVEKTATFSVGYRGFILNNFFVNLNTGVKRVVNYDHATGDNRSLPYFNLVLSGFISAPINLD